MEYIKKIEGIYWDKNLDDNINLLEDIQIYGEYIIGLINENLSNKKLVGKVKDNFHESVLILLLTESLQVLDGIISLFKGQSIDISIDLVRSLLELAMYIVYILKDDALVEKRAIAYAINSINDKIKSYEKINITSNDKKYTDAKNNLLNVFLKYTIYNEVKTEWDNKENGGKQLNNKKCNKKRKVKWYSVHGGGNNFMELCKYINLEQVYEVYGLYSNKIHGSDAMHGVYVNKNNEVFIKNPKIPFYAPEIIECIYSLMSVIYIKIIKYFLELEEDVVNFQEWDRKINIEKERLQDNWKDFRDKYIKSGELY